MHTHIYIYIYIYLQSPPWIDEYTLFVFLPKNYIFNINLLSKGQTYTKILTKSY